MGSEMVMESDDLVYERLAEALDRLANGFVRTPSNVEIRLLQKIFSLEEASIACQLTGSMEPCEAISERLGLPVGQAESMLTKMVDKGMLEKDIPWGKFDTLLGSTLTVLVAVFIVIVTGTLLKGVEIDSASQAAEHLMKTNHYVGTFMAIGLFDAGLLGAICISLASSWAFGEIFGWAHSLNQNIKEARWFYASYFFTLITAGLVVLIPGAPLVLITLFVQVIAVTLLPAALVFLILLLNDRETMGDYCNGAWQNLIGGFIVVTIVLLSSLYGISVMFPNLFQ